jgi:predicted NAD-dependent protein-ADP-ribosyltransferase YbiA (DUF1768 family)
MSRFEALRTWADEMDESDNETDAELHTASHEKQSLDTANETARKSEEILPLEGKKVTFKEPLETTEQEEWEFHEKKTYSLSNERLSFSTDAPDKKPGALKHDLIRHPGNYEELATIQHWRRKLGNHWIAPFETDGRTWNTLEHRLQASKIAFSDPEKAELFTLESQSELSKGDGNMAKKSGHIVKMRPEELEAWKDKKNDLLADALRCKFGSNQEMKRVLLATGEAELYYISHNEEPRRQKLLEFIRSELS